MKLEIRFLYVIDGGGNMCDYCRNSPCTSGCPNAEEEIEEYVCEECGDGIYVGDKCLKVWRDGSVYRYHDECGRYALSLEELTEASIEIVDYNDDWW